MVHNIRAYGTKFQLNEGQLRVLKRMLKNYDRDMRNLLIGLFLGATFVAGLKASAERKGPKLTGESGRLKYAVVVEGQVECVDAWVSIPERTIECDSDAPSGPGNRLELFNRIADVADDTKGKNGAVGKSD
jgi:hypothetical protein